MASGRAPRRVGCSAAARPSQPDGGLATFRGMTRLTCPGCGAGVDASGTAREHECDACGTTFALAADAHGFAVVVSEDRLGVRVAVEGEIDLVTAPVLARHLEGAIERGRDLVELDLSRVTFMDARGVNVLVAARNAAGGAAFSLYSPSDAVRRTLRLCGVDTALAPVS